MAQMTEQKESQVLDHEDVVERPTSPEIPQHIEKGGMAQNSSATQPFTAQVKDDQGNNLIFTPTTPPADVVIPEPVNVLEDTAKGDPENSKTWLAAFLLRVIDKAKHFGRKLIYSKEDQQLESDTNKV